MGPERKSDNQPFYSNLYADPVDDRAESLLSFTESAVYKLRQQNLSSYSLPSESTDANLILTRLDTPYSNRSANGLMSPIAHYESENEIDQEKQSFFFQASNEKQEHLQLERFREPINEYADKISHRINEEKGDIPPLINHICDMLKTDLIHANNRTHQLILKLRALWKKI